MAAEATLADLPEEMLLQVLLALDVDSLASFSASSKYFRALSLRYVWPRVAARKAGFSALQQDGNAVFSTVREWQKFISTMEVFSAARTLHASVQLQRTDSVASLALKYAVSTQDILRTNALFSEQHVATRRHLYIPLTNDDFVTELTGATISQQRPTLMRDCTLADRIFLVAHFQSAGGESVRLSGDERREKYIRELLVSLISRGYSVDESEVRYYLEENEFNISKACKAILDDRAWSHDNN